MSDSVQVDPICHLSREDKVKRKKADPEIQGQDLLEKGTGNHYMDAKEVDIFVGDNRVHTCLQGHVFALGCGGNGHRRLAARSILEMEGRTALLGPGEKKKKREEGRQESRLRVWSQGGEGCRV